MNDIKQKVRDIINSGLNIARLRLCIDEVVFEIDNLYKKQFDDSMEPVRLAIRNIQTVMDNGADDGYKLERVKLELESLAGQMKG